MSSAEQPDNSKASRIKKQGRTPAHARPPRNRTPTGVKKPINHLLLAPMPSKEEIRVISNYERWAADPDANNRFGATHRHYFAAVICID